MGESIISVLQLGIPLCVRNFFHQQRSTRVAQITVPYVGPQRRLIRHHVAVRINVQQSQFTEWPQIAMRDLQTACQCTTPLMRVRQVLCCQAIVICAQSILQTAHALLSTAPPRQVPAPRMHVRQAMVIGVRATWTPGALCDEVVEEAVCWAGGPGPCRAAAW